MFVPPLVDLHEDISAYIISGSLLNKFPLRPLSEDVPGRHADIPKYKKSNTRLVVGAVFPMIPWYSDNGEIIYKHYPDLGFVFENITLYHNLARAHKELKLVFSKEDILRLFQGGGDRIGLMIGLEGADPIKAPDELGTLYRIGLRMLGLTWNYNNRYAASCMSRVDMGLTREGIELVEKALELGIVVDLAHSSPRTVKEVYEVTGKPIIVSHANAKSVHNVARNLDDKTLELIAESKGVVGLVFISTFISDKNPDIRALMKHILYICENYGIEIIAIGSDYFGSLDLSMAKGVETIDKITNLWRTLLEHGFTKDEIEKIAWENAFRALASWLK
ncbi:MAG: peptidase [Thermoprotei archaeon]|nr:MAG: peptidase [Thermoprotei archaeon]